MLLSQVLDLHNDHVATIATAAVKKTTRGCIWLNRADHLEKAIPESVEPIIETKVDDFRIRIGFITPE